MLAHTLSSMREQRYKSLLHHWCAYYLLDGKKIIAVINTAFAVVKRKPEKIRLVRGSNPMTSAIPVQRSNQLS